MNHEQLVEWNNHPVTVELIQDFEKEIEEVKKQALTKVPIGMKADQLGLITAENCGLIQGLSFVKRYLEGNKLLLNNEIYNARNKNNAR